MPESPQSKMPQLAHLILSLSAGSLFDTARGWSQKRDTVGVGEARMGGGLVRGGARTGAGARAAAGGDRVC